MAEDGQIGKPMREDTRLHAIRTNLFYGLLDYTKSFPDFSIPQKFLMASPREGKELLERISSSLRDEREILLYVHLPFCVSECVFCNAFPQKASQDTQEKYILSLLKEIDIYAQSGILSGKKVKCVYLGGGTPTTFSNRDIQSILGTIESNVELSEDCNITSEAHPRDLIKNDRMTEL
jgi:oxygen-independent coproporphyrinogen-3 oxidase